jgi:hypothetical protein
MTKYNRTKTASEEAEERNQPGVSLKVQPNIQWAELLDNTKSELAAEGGDVVQ